MPTSGPTMWGSPEPPLVDQASQELARGVGGDQFRALLIGVTESRHVEGDDPPQRRDLIPDATEGPQAFGPWRQHEHGGVRFCLGIRVPHSHPIAHAEVGRDRGSRFCAHLLVSFFGRNSRRLATGPAVS